MSRHTIICAGAVLFLLGVFGEEIRAQIPYPYVREADVMWSKRVWRALDLREKFNHPFYFPTEDLPDRVSLFSVIKKGINDGKITKIFDFDIFSNEFGAQLNPVEAKNKMTETIQIRDENGEPVVDSLGNPVTMQDTLRPERIAQYWIKEDWFFDKQRSVMDVRIIGIAPVIEVSDEAIGRFSYKPLFWLYFPDCRKVFFQAKVYNPSNDADRRNFDEVFHKRMFSSYIIQESNVYGRPIAAYAQGEEALMESERVKETIFKMENDMWHY